MRYMCKGYDLKPYYYTYGTIITIEPDNNWYEVIQYMRKKMIYSHKYSSTYDVRVQMLLPKNVLVYIRYENKDLILIPYVSTFYATYAIKGMTNISGCK